MTRRKDREQDERLDMLEDDQVLQVRIDDEQDSRLEAVEGSMRGVNAELPAIDTPQGAEQRLKLVVPSPLTVLTLGAIGNADAGGHPFGPAGFQLRTVRNFAAEIKERTILDSDGNIVVHTPETFTSVAGKKLHQSTNGDYQLGTVGGVSISAASGAGFADPAFTVDPQMAVPDPPAIDTKGPREATETAKTAWGAIWTAYDTYSGAKALKTWWGDRKLSDGMSKDTFAGVATGMYGLYSAGKKLYDGASLAYQGAVAAAAHIWPSEKPSGPGKPKVTIYADDGISVLTPEKISLFSTTGGISLDCPHKVGIKAGVSASMKAGIDATVFSFVSAKVESKGICVVKGTYTSVTGDLTEIIGKKIMTVSSKEKVAIESDDLIRISTPKKAQLAGTDVHINTDREVYMHSNDAVTARAEQVATVWGTKQIYAGSDTEILITIKGKSSDIKLKDGEIDILTGDSGVMLNKSEALITGPSASAKFDSAFVIEGSAASKIKAPNITLG
ncbi:MAG: hypothetical protein KF729_13375 [Sandaracinaceae bacterium]|nr:hypothetical protein [Sandaracinaceae bacterium]